MTLDRAVVTLPHQFADCALIGCCPPQVEQHLARRLCHRLRRADQPRCKRCRVNNLRRGTQKWGTTMSRTSARVTAATGLSPMIGKTCFSKPRRQTGLCRLRVPALAAYLGDDLVDATEGGTLFRAASSLGLPPVRAIRRLSAADLGVVVDHQAQALDRVQAHPATHGRAEKRDRGTSKAGTSVRAREQSSRTRNKGHRPAIDRADKLCRALGITMTNRKRGATWPARRRRRARRAERNGAIGPAHAPATPRRDGPARVGRTGPTSRSRR